MPELSRSTPFRPKPGYRQRSPQVIATTPNHATRWFSNEWGAEPLGSESVTNPLIDEQGAGVTRTQAVPEAP
jgi:hypothetical protein